MVGEIPEEWETRMRYVVLIYSNPESRAVWEGLSDTERGRGLAAYRALDEELAASGEMVVSHALADPSHATRVAVTGGSTMTTDGPFAEAKEHLAGFFLVDCESRERAVEIAARVPEAGLGLVEVRTTVELSSFER